MVLDNQERLQKYDFNSSLNKSGRATYKIKCVLSLAEQVGWD